MAYTSVWFLTDLPSNVVSEIEKDLSINFDGGFENSSLIDGSTIVSKRNSLNTWIPDHHWITGFLWNYVMKANNENFLYDLQCLDSGALQYTCYKEGMFYGWHTDGGMATNYKPMINNRTLINEDVTTDYLKKNVEKVRKLSFSLQLSNHDDYEGGNVEFFDEDRKKYVAPRHRGSIIFFDSRTVHRVTKVRSGIRKSIVGWVLGPRWR